MVKRKIRIDKLDTRLFGSLARARRPLPIGKLAKRTDMSWSTAKKHIQKLEELKVVEIEKTIRRTNVSLSGSFLKKLKKRRLI